MKPKHDWNPTSRAKSLGDVFFPVAVVLLVAGIISAVTWLVSRADAETRPPVVGQQRTIMADRLCATSPAMATRINAMPNDSLGPLRPKLLAAKQLLWLPDATVVRVMAVDSSWVKVKVMVSEHPALDSCTCYVPMWNWVYNVRP
jgi:hypothetical protein